MSDSTDAIDPKLKAAIENWWNTTKPYGFRNYCQGCGKPSENREAFGFTPSILMMKCPCGHLLFFDLDAFKKKAGIP